MALFSQGGVMSSAVDFEYGNKTNLNLDLSNGAEIMVTETESWVYFAKLVDSSKDTSSVV